MGNQRELRLVDDCLCAQGWCSDHLHFFFEASPQTSVTSADLLHNNQVLSTPGSTVCFSDDFTSTASVIWCPGFSSRLYSCFRFFRRQNKMMFTMSDRTRPAIKGITIVQLKSETTEYQKTVKRCQPIQGEWLTIIGRSYAKYCDLSVASRSIICRSERLKQIISQRDSGYFAITKFNYCFDHQVCFQSNVPFFTRAWFQLHTIRILFAA